MSPRKIITLLFTGICLTVHAQDSDTIVAEEAEEAVAQEEDFPDDATGNNAEEDTTTVEIRDFNGQTRQERWLNAMWDKQKLGEWDEMANTRLSIRRVPAAAMDELHKMKALQYDQEEKEKNRSALLQRIGLWVLEHIALIRNTFYILLGALLLLTVVLFIRKSDISLWPRARRSTGEESEEAAATGPQNYDTLAQAAIAAEDYRSAVRMRYLQALHILQVKELIVPGKDKTNMDFLRELSATAFHKPFANLTRHYEYIWYGKVPLNNGQFMQLDEQFAEFKKSLRS